MKPLSEHAEQCQVIAFLNTIAVLRWRKYVMPDGQFCYFAVPNGGKRDEATGAKLKSEGVRAGVPDLMIPIPRMGFVGLAIEMKRAKGGVLSPSQKMWGETLHDLGWYVAVCHGAAAAIETIERYMDGGE